MVSWQIVLPDPVRGPRHTGLSKPWMALVYVGCGCKKTDPSHPWMGLQVKIHPNAIALFDMAIVTINGDGTNTRFWRDRWLQGRTISKVAPNLVSLVPRWVFNQWTVAQATENMTWVTDIRGVLSVIVLEEYLQLWDLLEAITLQNGVPDHHYWKLFDSGVYASKYAYSTFFVSSIRFAPWKHIWKTWAPLLSKFFL